MSVKLPKLTPKEADELGKDLAFNMVYHGDLKLGDLPEEIHPEYEEWKLKYEE